MNLACPECQTVYRIDPERVPEGGVGTRCRECGTLFRVERSTGGRPGEVVTARVLEEGAQQAGAAGSGAAAGSPAAATPAPSAESVGGAGAGEPEAWEPSPESGTGSPAAPVFGPQDPDTRARRLARALVSDIKVYNPDKWKQSRAAGTLRQDFRDEILKSWEEYVEQVGEERAKGTPFFRDALNDILAAGGRVF